MTVRLLAAAAVGTALLAAAPQTAAAQGSPLGGLFSCSAPGSANTTGAVVGGLAGALVGSQVSKNERTLGAVVGAGLGAMAGNYIGCKMDQNSRSRAETAVRTALETGRTQDWYDQRSGASGRVEVISTGRAGYGGGYGEPVDGRSLRYARGVQQVYGELEPVSPTYTAPRTVNMRAAPSTSARIVASVPAGGTLDVAGETDGWLAVTGPGGRVRGYVSASVVRPSGAPAYAAAPQGPAEGCRTIRQTITLRGQRPETSRYEACRDQRGEWVLTPA